MSCKRPPDNYHWCLDIGAANSINMHRTGLDLTDSVVTFNVRDKVGGTILISGDSSAVDPATRVVINDAAAANIALVLAMADLSLLVQTKNYIIDISVQYDAGGDPVNYGVYLPVMFAR